ncbi:flagellar assembly peptidoglycan hydrolase FlgJ [Kaarinaea lacus]
MTAPVNSANVYTDLHGLEQMRHNVKGDSEADLRAAAQQFEALFIQQMLKSMREANLSEGLFDSQEGDFYMDLFDKQISLNLSEGRGIGLADILVEQIARSMPLKNTEDTQSQNEDQLESKPVLGDTSFSVKPSGNTITSSSPNVVDTPIATDVDIDKKVEIKKQALPLLTNDSATYISDPKAFIQTFWPLAQKASADLGVPPRVLLAQAALETGWGQHIGLRGDGKSTHNLFNIKADGRWQGDTATIPTMEFRDGVAQREYAAFRAYNSYNESFEDYVRFLKSSSRYQPALQKADSAHQYVASLQKAGYATDPDYSAKIMQIIDGETMNRSLEELKF